MFSRWDPDANLPDPQDGTPGGAYGDWVQAPQEDVVSAKRIAKVVIDAGRTAVDHHLTSLKVEVHTVESPLDENLLRTLAGLFQKSEDGRVAMRHILHGVFGRGKVSQEEYDDTKEKCIQIAKAGYMEYQGKATYKKQIKSMKCRRQNPPCPPGVAITKRPGRKKQT